MGNQVYALEWLQFASRNLITAQHLFEVNHSTDIIAIDAQQAIEKTLKPYALMVGIPARQIGWVSRAGNTLSFDENGAAVDHFDNSKYKLENDELKETA